MDAALSKRFWNDYGLSRGRWEVERATLEGRTKGHAVKPEEKEEER